MLIVKITDSAYDQIWYAGRIKELFYVRSHPDPAMSNLYQVIEVDAEGVALDDSTFKRTIYKRDCEIVQAKNNSDILSNSN